jgi:hypothetical protein
MVAPAAFLFLDKGGCEAEAESSEAESSEAESCEAESCEAESCEAESCEAESCEFFESLFEVTDVRGVTDVGVTGVEFFDLRIVCCRVRLLFFKKKKKKNNHLFIPNILMPMNQIMHAKKLDKFVVNAKKSLI